MPRAVGGPRRWAAAAVLVALLLAPSPQPCEAARRGATEGPGIAASGSASSPFPGGGRLGPRPLSATSLAGRRPPPSVAAFPRSRRRSPRGQRRESTRRRPWRRAALPFLTAVAAVAQLPDLAYGQHAKLGVLEPGRALKEPHSITQAIAGQVQMIKWSPRPYGGFTVPRAKLKDAQLKQFLTTKGAADWPYTWTWQPFVFFWDYGTLAQLSGVYDLVELNPEEAVWERSGGGHEVRFHYKRAYGNLTLISAGREGGDLFKTWAHFSSSDDDESDDILADVDDWADFVDSETSEAWAEEMGRRIQRPWSDWAEENGYGTRSLDSIGDESSSSRSGSGLFYGGLEPGRVDLSAGRGSRFGWDHVDLDDPDAGGGFGTHMPFFNCHLEFSHQVGDETRLWAVLKMRTDMYWEGMPVWRSTERDPDYPHKDKWVVSMRGQWHYGEAPPGRTVEELASNMFFNPTGLYAASWTHYTGPHAGDPPEDFEWYS